MANAFTSQTKVKKKKHRITLVTVVLFITVFLVFVPLLTNKHYVLASVLFLILSFLPFMVRFEQKKVTARELVILAVLAALAAVSRIPFAALPSVQPATFVIIITGIVFGAESGFVVGALTALVSNLFLGQGPWTPWQMYAWGMIGLVAGLLKDCWLMQTNTGRILFGFISGILFGWMMNLWIVLSLIQSIGWGEVITYYAASLPFDVTHGLSNVLFLLLFANSWLRILTRFKKSMAC